MNKAAINFTGYNLDKESLNVTEIIYTEDFKYAISSFFSFLNDEDKSNYQLRIFTKSKEIKWIELKPSIILNKKGEPQFTQGIFRDITKQKELEIIFKNQKQELDVIVDNSSLGIVLTNLKAEIIKSNKAFQNLLEYTEEELLSKSVKEISLKEDEVLSQKKIIELNSGIIDSFSLNKRYKTKNGKIIWAKTNVKSVKNNKGEIIQQVAIIEDITKEVKQDEKLDILLKNLTKSNKELKGFAHVVSHDLKTPLRSMNTLVTWIEEENETFSIKNKKNFALLHKNINKMEFLIDGILNYESIDKVQRKLKKINVNILLKDILDITYIPNHINITIENNLPTIKGDTFRLQQLFQNIIGNSIKYIDKENGIININCISYNNFWKFIIEDNGIGISEKYFNKIFEVFQTLEETNESTGIGLSIVKKIITFYNGEIWLNSTPKIGTIFYFTLPK